MIFKTYFILFFISLFFSLSAELAFANRSKTAEKQSASIPIAEIQIISPNKKINSRILPTKLYKNKVFSQKLSQDILISLRLALKKQKVLLPQITGPLFSFTPQGLSISYQVKNPFRYGFILKGNKKFSDEQVFSPKVYKKYFDNPQLIRKTLEGIKESYLKKGYSQVQVSHYITTDKKHFIKTVFISIQEGYRVRVGKFRVFGQFSKPNRHYIRLLRSLSGPFIRKRIFYGPDIQQGLKNLTNILQNKGYLNAQARVRITKRPQNKVWVDLIFKRGPVNCC